MFDSLVDLRFVSINSVWDVFMYIDEVFVGINTYLSKDKDFVFEIKHFEELSDSRKIDNK